MSVVDGPPGSGAAREAGPGDVARRAPWVDAEPPIPFVLGAAAILLLAAAAVEIALGDTVGWFFGGSLVLVSAGAAVLVRPRDLFTAGVLPPLLLLGLLVVLAVAHPDGIAVTELEPSASVPQRVIAGFVDLAGALVVAHAVTFALVALRVRTTRLRRRAPPRAVSQPR